MSSLNLWGNLPSGDEVRAPVSILRQQASLLGEMTGNVLLGRVDPRPQVKAFTYDLDIIASALNNYIYTVLQITHPIDMYPVTVTGYSNQKSYVCANEQAYEAALGEVLASEETRRVISSLLAQSKQG